MLRILIRVIGCSLRPNTNRSLKTASVPPNRVANLMSIIKEEIKKEFLNSDEKLDNILQDKWGLKKE